MNGRYKKKRHYRISLLHVAVCSPVCLIKKSYIVNCQPKWLLIQVSFLVFRLEQSELQVDETIFILSQYIASH